MWLANVSHGENLNFLYVLYRWSLTFLWPFSTKCHTYIWHWSLSSTGLVENSQWNVRFHVNRTDIGNFIFNPVDHHHANNSLLQRQLIYSCFILCLSSLYYYILYIYYLSRIITILLYCSTHVQYTYVAVYIEIPWLLARHKCTIPPGDCTAHLIKIHCNTVNLWLCQPWANIVCNVHTILCYKHSCQCMS